ncbi:hypothetical protein GCM10023187_18830 [Nibrella viscosa]|uniref:Tetratricopeptide repeat-containing protein n=1 Tax=Nibrella viscosa TaxID=1084524 RepID=A0ABP8KA58_9BACT
MELSDELLEQINAYLSGRMAVAEKDRFETQLRQDADLRREVASQREIKEGIAMIAQKQRFRQLHADLEKRGLLTETDNSVLKNDNIAAPAEETKVISFPARQSVFRANWTYWAAAATIVLVVGLGWMFFRDQSGGQQVARNEQLFNSVFATDLKPAPILPTDPDRVAAPEITPATLQDSVRLQEAVTALRQGRTQAAIQRLRPMVQRAPGHWQASAQWYLALAYLKNNQPEQARQTLSEIAALNGHPYQQEARALIGQLALSD